MVKITMKSVLPGKQQDVFKYIGDFLNVPKWDPGTIKVTLASKNNMQVGTKYDVVTVMDGKEEPMKYEIVEITENSVTLKGDGNNWV
jgi:hypothetical protein